MKRPYSKPRIAVEELTLDQPIAATCTADRQVMDDLISLGYFADDTCEKWLLDGENGKGGYIDWNKDGAPDSTHDTVCYHSNVQTAFLS